MAAVVRGGDEISAAVRNDRAHFDRGKRQRRLDGRAELFEARARARRDEECPRLEAAEQESSVIIDQVGLVEDDDLPGVPRSDVPDHVSHGLQLRGGVGVRGVDDMQDDVGVADLLQGRAERLDELVREVAHEADGVGQRVDPAVGCLRATDGGIERREQRVLDEDSRAREPVEKARLPGVGVAGDRDGWDRVALAFGPLRIARGRIVADLAAQQRHLGADAATVELDLRLTRTAGAHARAARADLATGLTAHGVTPSAKSREQVFELRELDLGLALTALGVLAEDVEDHRGPVDDLDLHDVFEGAALARRQLGIGDHRVGADRSDDVAQLLRLAAPHISRRVGMRPALQHAVEDDGARGLGEG